ncbi:MAG: hypothetical protein A2Z57_15100 [Planctomycetes bacterium RIFCSPHIGHO2_12_39_6]|nr:MAG: hypothetical protein A2W74_01830 [Planctomycetes bacterium RIFCSPLOWO2_12_38_17]OHC04366.1 MAG: hypothetical protein A2Z57_15100 [Planctomycetes bacterium RIFCSPHIGHO2_12_39_6]
MGWSSELPDRYFINRRKTKKVGDILKGLYGSSKAQHKGENARLCRIWKNAVSKEIYECTEIIGIKGRVLYVGIKSPTLLHYMRSFVEQGLIKMFNDNAGGNIVDRISFKMIEEDKE